MSPDNEHNASEVRTFAQFLCEASEADFVNTFHRLRARRELTSTVHALGKLSTDAVHGSRARAALHRFGLDDGG